MSAGPKLRRAAIENNKGPSGSGPLEQRILPVGFLARGKPTNCAIQVARRMQTSPRRRPGPARPGWAGFPRPVAGAKLSRLGQYWASRPALEFKPSLFMVIIIRRWFARTQPPAARWLLCLPPIEFNSIQPAPPPRASGVKRRRRRQASANRQLAPAPLPAADIRRLSRRPPIGAAIWSWLTFTCHRSPGRWLAV